MKIGSNNILIVSLNERDENNIHHTLDGAFDDSSFHIIFEHTLYTAKQIISKQIDLVILNIPEHKNCIEILKEITTDFSNFPVIVYLNKPEEAVEFIKMGADDLLTIEDITNNKFISKCLIAIERRKKFIKSLHNRENLLTAIIEGTTDSVFIKDIKGKYLFINHAAAKVANKTKELIIGKDDTKIYNSVNARIVMDMDKKVMESNETLNYPINITTPDGVARNFNATKGPIKDENGKTIGMFGISRDITLNVQSEKLLKERTTRLRLMIDNSNDFIMLMDAEMSFTLVNKTICTALGLEFKDLLGTKISELVHPEDKKLQEISFMKSLANPHIPIEHIVRIQSKDGYKIVDFKFINCIDIQGLNGIIVEGTDVTERIATENKLRETVSVLESTLESTADGILVVSNSGNITEYNATFKRLWNIPESIIQKHDDAETLGYVINQLKEPDTFIKKVEHLYANPEEVSFDIVEFKNGTVLERYSQPQRIAGQIVGRVWSFRDITEKVKSEEEILKLSRALEQSPVSVLITDTDGNIEYVNPNFTKVSGFPLEEVKGKKPSVIKSGITPDEVYQNLWSTIKKGEEWRGELINKKKNGELFWESFSVSPVKDRSGTITHFIAVKEDITERKNAEKELFDAYDKERHLIEHLQTIREEERAKIAREIHDEIGQHLTVLKMDIVWLNKKLEGKEDAAITTRLNELQSLLDVTVKSFRRILSELRPTLIDDVGLEAAIEWHINEFGRNNGIATEFIVDIRENSFTENINLAIFRIIQESFNNIAKHAKAKHVKVSLIQEENKLSLVIKDDGIGIDTVHIANKKSFGLLGIKERVLMNGGKFEISSQPNKGTTLIVVLPL